MPDTSEVGLLMLFLQDTNDLRVLRRYTRDEGISYWIAELRAQLQEALRGKWLLLRWAEEDNSML